MNFVRRGIDAGEMIDDLLQRRGFPSDIIELLPVRLEEIGMDVDAALADIGENDEFVAEVAADRSGFGPHWDRL